MDDRDYAEQHRNIKISAANQMTIVKASIDQLASQIDRARALFTASIGNSQTSSALNASDAVQKMADLVTELREQSEIAGSELERYGIGF